MLRGDNDDDNVSPRYVFRVVMFALVSLALLLPLAVYIVSQSIAYNDASLVHKHIYDSNRIDTFDTGMKYTSFQQYYFVKHLQCRRCVAYADLPLIPDGSTLTPDALRKLYFYEPYTRMKWCPTHSSDSQQYDAYGRCIAHNASCSLSTITEVTECPGDSAAYKASCSACVLDDYVWCRQHADEKVEANIDRLLDDEYSGYCASTPLSNVTGDGSSSSHCMFATQEATHIAQCHNIQFDSAVQLIAAGGRADNNGHIVPPFLLSVPIAAMLLTLCRLRVYRTGTIAWPSNTTNEPREPQGNMQPPPPPRAAPAVPLQPLSTLEEQPEIIMSDGPCTARRR